MANLTAQQFRANFPEFGSTSLYPNGQVDFWLGNAYDFLPLSRWGNRLDLGVQLYTAHNLSLSSSAQQAAENGGGGAAGQSGPISSQSVDKVSVSFDVGSVTLEGAGNWNATSYGTRLYALMRIFGAGPVQVGIGCPTPMAAWPGPNTMPGFTSFG